MYCDLNRYFIRRVHEIIVAAVLACSFEANLEEMSCPSKPLIIMEAYQEGDGWYKWITRFENVAAVNDWGAAAKLKVCLAGRAQKVFQG